MHILAETLDPEGSINLDDLFRNNMDTSSQKYNSGEKFQRGDGEGDLERQERSVPGMLGHTTGFAFGPQTFNKV